MAGPATAWPDDDTIWRLVDSLAVRLHENPFDVLYIRCPDGRRRTGTVSALLLGRLFAFDACKALELYQRMHDMRETCTSTAAPGSFAAKTVQQRLRSGPPAEGGWIGVFQMV